MGVERGFWVLEASEKKSFSFLEQTVSGNKDVRVCQ